MVRTKRNFLVKVFGKEWPTTFAYIGIIFALSLSGTFLLDKCGLIAEKLTAELIKDIFAFTIIYALIQYQQYTVETNKMEYDLEAYLQFNIISRIEKMIVYIKYIRANKKYAETTLLKTQWLRLKQTIDSSDTAKYSLYLEKDVTIVPKEVDVEWIDRFLEQFKDETNQGHFNKTVEMLESLKIHFENILK
jgi:hypothetical protein